MAAQYFPLNLLASIIDHTNVLPGPCGKLAIILRSLGRGPRTAEKDETVVESAVALWVAGILRCLYST